jgi:hypothetical protein
MKSEADEIDYPLANYTSFKALSQELNQAKKYQSLVLWEWMQCRRRY